MVILGGPDCWTVGVGAILSSDWFEKPSNPINAITITMDDIAAPNAREGPWINHFYGFFDTFSLLFYMLFERLPGANTCNIFDENEMSFSEFIVMINVSILELSEIKYSVSITLHVEVQHGRYLLFRN